MQNNNTVDIKGGWNFLLTRMKKLIE